MGTDMTLFVELVWDRGSATLAEFTNIRDYELFDALGNGRTADNPLPLTGKSALIEPRGFPPGLSWGVLTSLFKAELDPTSAIGRMWRGGFADGTERGEPLEVDLGRWFPNIDTPPSTRMWLGEEFRDPGWLSPREVLESLRANGIDVASQDDPLVTALVAFIEALVDAPVRVVFVFDD